MDYILIIVLFFLVFRNSSKIDDLRKEISRLKGEDVDKSFYQEAVTPAENQNEHSGVSYEGGGSVPAATGTYDNTPGAIENFFAWLKVDFFVKLGALLLLIGFGWFVTYAFANNWIGPVGRIVLGLATGVGVMLLGTWRIKAFATQGAIFTILGSGITLMTVYAARVSYDMFDPASALLIMLLAVGYSAFVSVIYRNNPMALISLLLAGLVPILTASTDPSVVGLFSYLLVVVLGTLWVVRITGNHVLTLTANAMLLLYSVPFFSTYSMGNDDLKIGLLFSVVFAGIFLVFNTISIVRSGSDGARKAQLTTAFLTGLYILLWVINVVEEEWMSLTFVAWMLLFSLSTFMIYSQTANRVPFYLYGAVSIGFLFAATATELIDTSLEVLAIVYTAEVTALIIAGMKILPLRTARKLSIMFLLPVVMSLGSLMQYSWDDGFFSLSFFVLTLLSASLAVVGWMFHELGKTATQEDGYEGVKLEQVLMVISALYALAIVWLSLHAGLFEETATFLSLSIYTVTGIALFVKGRVSDNKTIMYTGALLLGGVTVRLLLIDIWNLELAMRIVTLFVIGVLLISTAFIGNKKQ